MILVRQLTFGTTATFLGLFRAVPEGTYLNDYILLDGNGFIKTFSEKCTTYFGFTPMDVQRYQMVWNIEVATSHLHSTFRNGSRTLKRFPML